MPAFTQAHLFGGAISVDVPVTFMDVSTIRPVPDHQEVYVGANGLTSILFDLTERVEATHVVSDNDALLFHFEDAISPDKESTKIWRHGIVADGFHKLPNIPVLSLFATLAEPSDNSPGSPNFTAIMMYMLRLQQQKTDIIITVNVPHKPNDARSMYSSDQYNPSDEKVSQLLDVAIAYSRKIQETFEIKDWSLFVNEKQ